MGGDFIAELFVVVGAVITGLGTTFTSIFGMLYGGTPAALTPLGVLVALGVGAPVAYLILAWIVSLFKRVKIFGGAKGK